MQVTSIIWGFMFISFCEPDLTWFFLFYTCYDFYFNYIIICVITIITCCIMLYESEHAEEYAKQSYLLKFIFITLNYLFTHSFKDIIILIFYGLKYLVKEIIYLYKAFRLKYAIIYLNIVILSVWRPIIKKTSYYEYYRSAVFKFDEVRFTKNKNK